MGRETEMQSEGEGCSPSSLRMMRGERAESRERARGSMRKRRSKKKRGRRGRVSEREESHEGRSEKRGWSRNATYSCLR
jgi:hypothetical protein